MLQINSEILKRKRNQIAPDLLAIALREVLFNFRMRGGPNGNCGSQGCLAIQGQLQGIVAWIADDLIASSVLCYQDTVDAA